MYFKLSVAILLAVACANAQSLGTITPTGSLGGLRQSHTATLLISGDVLIAGGIAVQPRLHDFRH